MLIVEKIIKLLDDFHYQAFADHVRTWSTRSFYPDELVRAIHRDLDSVQHSDELCRLVYEENDEKTMKKFFQMAHYTFKLTAFLSRNYPHYLQHNISRIQRLINTGSWKKANQLADLLLEICQKIEDHNTEIQILRIQVQQNVLLESGYYAIKLEERIGVLQVFEQEKHQLFKYYLEHFDPKANKKSKQSIDTHLEFLKTFRTSESVAVQLISRYLEFVALYHHRDERFFSKKNYDELLVLENDLQRYDYILFPFLFDIMPRIRLFKILLLRRTEQPDAVITEASKLLTSGINPLFRNSFIDSTELFSIAVHSGYYINNYMQSYRENHSEQLPEKVRIQFDLLKDRCIELLSNQLLEERFLLRYISLNTAYAGLLICGNKEEVAEAIRLMEGIILSFQQMSIHPFVDSIYVILIMGCFSLQDNKKLDENYRKYCRTVKGKTTNPENDLNIHGFFYAAKWRENGRQQYVRKFNAVLQQADEAGLVQTQRLLKEVADYYEIPITVA